LLLLPALALLAPVLPAAPASTAAAPVRIVFLDVGQGDATLIRAGPDYEVLIDGGRKSAGKTVLETLRQLGIADLEAMLATHADADHLGGLVAILQDPQLPVESVLYNGYPGDTQTWAEFAAAVQAEGLALAPAQRPQAFDWGGVAVSTLSPPPGLLDPEQNQASVVLRLEIGPLAVILPADADLAVEAQLLAAGDPLAAQLLKVAHHGSKYSSSAEFLAAVDPAQAVISVGRNPYGHPAPETLARLAAAGVRVWRTDRQGSLVWRAQGDDYDLFPLNSYMPVAIHSGRP
jgi:competence protein ComEC